MVAAVPEAGSEKAAAHSLGLSHSTLKHHLANARTKVGATTTAQLVWILAPRDARASAVCATRRMPEAGCCRVPSAQRRVPPAQLIPSWNKSE